MLVLVSDENFNNDITRGLPHLRVLRQLMGEIYRLFDRRYCTATALSKLAILRKRVQRFTKRIF